MPDQEKEKEKLVSAPPVATLDALAKPAAAEVDSAQCFFGESLVGLDPTELNGSLIVIEGMDGSGRSTQIALLQEWLESDRKSVV